MKTNLKTALAAACIFVAGIFSGIFPALGQGSVPGQLLVPLGYCQLSAAQLAAAVKLSSCVRASFTATAGSPATKLVVTSVTGIILAGDQIVSGTGLTAGTVIVSQDPGGTLGGAGTYNLSATNTASSAATTSGGVPPGATSAMLQAETADVRFRDDGAAPTAALGAIVVHGTAPIYYTGTLTKLQFILLSGVPLLDVAFYR